MGGAGIFKKTVQMISQIDYASAGKTWRQDSRMAVRRYSEEA